LLAGLRLQPHHLFQSLFFPLDSFYLAKDALYLLGFLGVVELYLEVEVARANPSMGAAEVLLQLVELDLLTQLVAEEAQLGRGDLAAACALGEGVSCSSAWMTVHWHRCPLRGAYHVIVTI